MLNDLLYNLPTAVDAVIIISFAVAVSVAGLALTDRLVPVEVRKAHTEVAGFIFAGVGVIYAVLLAFIAVAVWAQFDKAEARIRKEANLVSDLYFDAQALPPPVAGRVQQALRDYAEAVIHGEWPQMVAGRTPDSAVLPLQRLFAAIMSYEPDTNRGTVYLAEILNRANELSEARRDRIVEAGDGLSTTAWGILLFGAVLTISFTYFFGTPRLGIHMAMTGALAASIALVMVLIVAMDYPFRGDVRVDPSPFEEALALMRHAPITS